MYRRLTRPQRYCGHTLCLVALSPTISNACQVIRKPGIPMYAHEPIVNSRGAGPSNARSPRDPQQRPRALSLGFTGVADTSELRTFRVSHAAQHVSGVEDGNAYQESSPTQPLTKQHMSYNTCKTIARCPLRGHCELLAASAPAVDEHRGSLTQRPPTSQV
jgi:hypothetical protein